MPIIAADDAAAATLPLFFDALRLMMMLMLIR